MMGSPRAMTKRECEVLTRVARGESTKDIAVEVVHAATDDDAVEVGRAVARSNLFKCAVHGNDPNWGRVLSALGTTDSAQKAKFYRDAQETIWKDKPWAPLVVEKLLSAHNKKLTGVYVMPDASFNFTEVDLH